MLTQSLTMDITKVSPQAPPSSSTHDGRPRLSHSTSNASSVFSEVDDPDHMTRVHEAASNGVKRRSRTLSENASRHQIVSNLSTSEPDLPNLDDVPPPLPPRDPDMLAPSTPTHDTRSVFGNRMVRGSSEHSLLTASLNIGPGHHRSPFHHGNAMMISPSHQTRSALSTPERKKHANTMDHSGSGTPKKLSAGKKASTFGRYSPSAEHQDGSVSKGSKKDKSKSRWTGIKDRMKLKQKFKRSPSIEIGKELGSSPREVRSQSIPTIRKNTVGSITRKTSVGPEVKLSVAMDVPDGGGHSPSRSRQRTLSVQGSGVTLISKIFSVLGCWQDNYYEVCI